ncbi:MAG: type IV secretory system conjugative DNA transfer family protein, partial [Patescibacteria group bacterium]|nr:type IV secretory system conjugative DNA transfer family protein [Patescibacteria group bacterium]
KKIVLNSEEMASLFHFPLASSQTPNIQWLSSKEAPAPNNMPDSGIVLGENVYREAKTLIRISRSDRTRHIYAIGKSGTGKSEFLSNMAKQDILNGDGVAVIDPHGDLVNDILDTIPNERAEDVIYFDPANIERPMGINLLEYNKKYPEQKTFVINEMISIFDKLYDLKQTGGPMFEQYMRNAMLLVMEDPESGSTLMEISKVLADPDFRKYKLSKCLNPVVKDFWQKEAEKAGGDAALANMVPYITSKLNTFISNDIMRPIIGQQKSAFDLRTIMDKRKILLVNLSKGKIGEMNSYLLGMVLVGKILMSALSRTDIPRNERKDFYLYLDEFQNFITESITVILSEARKYRLNLNIAHQYIGQLSQKQDTSIRDAIFGNVGTIVSFKVGAEDAEFLSKEFAPVFSAYDLVNIDKFNAYVKLIIDNQPTRAFNMKTFPLRKNKISNKDRIKQFSKLKYGNDRSIIEAEILKRAKM